MMNANQTMRSTTMSDTVTATVTMSKERFDRLYQAIQLKRLCKQWMPDIDDADLVIAAVVASVQKDTSIAINDKPKEQANGPSQKE
jgi:hypothetical protein